MIEWLGIIGGGMFAAGCVPIAFNTVRAGKDLGTPLSTQWLLFLACVLFGVYLFGEFGPELPFFFLAIEVACWGAVLWYHYFPRYGGWGSNRVRRAHAECVQLEKARRAAAKESCSWADRGRTTCALGYGEACRPNDTRISCDCDLLLGPVKKTAESNMVEPDEFGATR